MAFITDIKRFAVHDGDGIRTMVFFSGCPLRCLWCHNPENLERRTRLMFYLHKCRGCGKCAEICSCHDIKDREHAIHREACNLCGKCAEVCPAEALTLTGKERDNAVIVSELLRDREFYETSGGGITLSGGECLCQPQACLDILRAMRGQGISTAVDTCGFVPRETIERVFPYTDAFLYDIKAYDEEVHIRCTGQSNRLIFDNLRYILTRGGRVEIRFPYVPGYNSDQTEKIARFLASQPPVTRVRVLPYHNFAASKYDALGIRNTLPVTLPTEEELQQARATFLAYGICCE